MEGGWHGNWDTLEVIIQPCRVEMQRYPRSGEHHTARGNGIVVITLYAVLFPWKPPERPSRLDLDGPSSTSAPPRGLGLGQIVVPSTQPTPYPTCPFLRFSASPLASVHRPTLCLPFFSLLLYTDISLCRFLCLLPCPSFFSACLLPSFLFFIYFFIFFL